MTVSSLVSKNKINQIKDESYLSYEKNNKNSKNINFYNFSKYDCLYISQNISFLLKVVIIL